MADEKTDDNSGKKESKEKSKEKKMDIFKKAYDTVTGVVQKSADILQEKFDSIIHSFKKKAFYFVIMTFAMIFLLFALAEFISYLYPIAGKTIGYLAVGAVLLVIAVFYKMGME